MRNFNGKTEYDIEHIGSYGRFSTGKSFPVEYIMTTFSAPELTDLSFARDIKSENLDFDLLLQRDIDEERVRGQMEPYLDPNLTIEEIKSKAVFFPPLLVAIIPTKNKSMESFYPNEISTVDDDNVIREWKNIFKLTYFRGSGPSEYEIEIVNNSGNLEKVSIDREPIKLQTRRVKGATQGASLVVIDGQHRLYALKEVYEKNPELINDLVVPVCILFSPNSTEYRQNIYGDVKVPTVPEVFRTLFVDVNTTMELVGGHFNILLSDDTIGSLACRQYCAYLLNSNEGKKALSVIEWNTKKKKDSTIIKRKYSLSSIGVIDLALQEIFSKNKTRTKYVLNLEEVLDELYPIGNDDAYPKVEWDRYSLTQKKIIEKQVSTYLIPSLYSIFFESKAYKDAFTIYVDKLDQLIKVSESDDNDALEARAVLNQVLDYIPIKSGKYHDSERKLYKDFVDELANLREAKSANIISYAIFQRGLFFAWANILDVAKQFAVDPVDATKAFVTLLDTALKDNGYAFESKKFYMQHSVFSDHSIIAKQEVRVALGNLILSFLGNDENSMIMSHNMGIIDGDISIAQSQFKDLGQTSAANFVKYYEKERIKSFKKKYSVDFTSLSSDERQELKELENQQSLQLDEVKQGKRNKENVEYLFDEKANSYIQEDVELATKDLKSVLKYDSDIIGGNGLDESE